MRAVDLRVMGAIHLLGGTAYGLDIMRVAGLGSGRCYPSLDRLEEMGWVESLWAPDTPEGELTRRVYRLVPRLTPWATIP